MILIGESNKKTKQSEDDSIRNREEIWAHSNVIFYSLLRSRVSLFPLKHNFLGVSRANLCCFLCKVLYVFFLIIPRHDKKNRSYRTASI